MGKKKGGRRKKKGEGEKKRGKGEKKGKIFFAHFHFHLNAQNVWRTGWGRARIASEEVPAFPDFPMESPLSPSAKFPRNARNSGRKRQEIGKNPEHDQCSRGFMEFPAQRAENPTVPKNPGGFAGFGKQQQLLRHVPVPSWKRAWIRPWKLLLRAQRAPPPYPIPKF